MERPIIPTKKYWPSVLSLVLGALLAIVSSVWASGLKIGQEQERLNDVCDRLLPQIERRQTSLEERVLRALEQQSKNNQDMWVLLERVDAQQQILLGHGRTRDGRNRAAK